MSQIETKSVAKALNIAGRTVAKYGHGNLGHILFMLSFSSRKESLDEKFGELTAWDLDNTIYAINRYVGTGRASVEFERKLNSLSVYQALDLVVKATNRASKKSINDRLEAVKALAA